MAGQTSGAERAAMAQAISLAAALGPPTSPNPRVGAVLLDALGGVIATGVHRGPGTPHAEVEALAAAGAAARGATAIVTLEPCNHTGRTPPCSQALMAAGVTRVVFGQPDPNPLAAGGATTLATAGIDVDGGVCLEQARALNPVWSFAMGRQRPLVTWKYAATIDGRVAANDGTSRWISGSESRSQVHQLRAEADAVVVGTGTALVDDPQLTVRDEGGEPLSRQPLRVVVGERVVPEAARVMDDAAPTLLLRTHDVADVLRELFALDVHHVLLEGGPTLAAAFLRAGVVDRVVGYLGPKLLGSGHPLVGPLEIDTIAGALQVHIDDVALVGGDIRWSGRIGDGVPRNESSAPRREDA